MNVKELLRYSIQYLKKRSIEDPVKEAGLLLSWALKKDEAFLYAHPDYSPEPSVHEKLLSILERRGHHEPFAYITGECEFMGLTFNVNRDVLIPRPDTELLAEAAIYALGENTPFFTQEMFRLPAKDFYRVLDAGTGSGCLSVSIARNVMEAGFLALDISQKALETAKKNAEAQGVGHRIRFVKSDILKDLPTLSEMFDLVVSNPPYIPNRDLPGLMPGVRDFEPSSALDGGEDGLVFYRALAYAAKGILTRQGILVVECGFDQGFLVEDIFKKAGMETLILKDLSGINRAVAGRFTENN